MKSRFIFPLLALAFIGAAVGCRRGGSAPAQEQLPPSVASADAPPTGAVGPFYVGVSSLDVEANERAAQLFDELTKQVPQEPAVWANLGLARLKLGDLPGAEQALGTAAKLAPKNGAITLLQATVDEDQGQFARAIERLRGLRDPSAAVLYRLAELLGRTGKGTDLTQQLELFDRMLKLQPNNPAIAFSRARLLARMENQPALVGAISGLETYRSGWEPAAVHQLDSAKTAAAAGNFRAAAAALTFLQNLTLATPAYQAGLEALGAIGGSVGQPIRQFLKYRQPVVAVAPADTALRFDVVDSKYAARPEFILARELSAKSGATLLSIAGGKLRLGGGAEVTSDQALTPGGIHSLCTADLDGDYFEDLACVDQHGLRIWKQDDGRFSAYHPNVEARAAFAQPAHGVWAIDFDADGDLDLLIARDGASPQILRNNSDGTFTPLTLLSSFPEVRGVCWADFDGDDVSDLGMLDPAGRVLVSWNNRAGAFSTPKVIAGGPAVAITSGDISGTGETGLIVLERDGAIRGWRFDRETRTWSSRELARWSDAPDLATTAAGNRVTMALADLDNNGALDLVISAGNTCAIWLNQGRGRLVRLEHAPALFVTSIADMDGDGFLDLVGLTEQGAAVAHGHGTKHYHWQSIQTRALASHADSRINSFGIGGRIEIRAGPLLTMAPIVGPHTHFGLGSEQQVGLARIVWPNGTAQVEFAPPADQEVTAIQRLKGSCPWVFARNGDTFQFVKDFIWRSPLGMRINSQDTAGVDQTQDWILIPGHFLKADYGEYELRITAELWETHFFDQVSLRTVDHPASVSAWVDERFVPTQQPKLAVICTTPPQPFPQVRDESGREVAKALAAVDGKYVDEFQLGRFQGIASDHWVEFQLPANVPVDESLVLIGTGWIFPTDSSLNVAISQGKHPAPHGLVLEAPDPQGGWVPVTGDLGFPAGKNKTVVIPLPHASLAAGVRRFRLRTNLEIYWDYLGWAETRPNTQLKITPAATRVADLRERGFSEMTPLNRRRPDLPLYAKLAGTGQRWQDLEGYYTRFGDVRELLAGTDDRYVIMNAGDEMVLRFAAPPPPPAGWTRDFVLVGDGWVKDGDFNTANSRTVLPLPSHAVHHYGGPEASLEADPVFQQHRDDWRNFHTRYVTPTVFERGLMQGVAEVTTTGGAQ